MKKLFLFVACAFVLMGCTESDNTNKKEKDNDVQEVEQVMDDALKSQDMVITDSLDANAYVRRARIYFAGQQIGNAMRDINSALSVDGSNMDALLLLADLYYALGDQDNIMVTLNKATEIAPYDTRPMIKLAELSFLQGNSKMADAYIDKALQYGSMNPQAYYLRGIICMSNNDTVNAMKNFMISRDQDDKFFDPVVQIAAIYAAQRNDLAKDFYDLAIEIQPENTGVYYEKALYLQDNGYPMEALAIYDTLDSKMPGNFDVTYNKGYVNLVYLQDYDKAIEYFDNALAISPNATNALLNKGIAYEQKGNFIEAKSIYLQILRNSPNYQLAIDALHRIGD